MQWARATIAPESRNLFSRYFSQEATADTPNHNRSDNTPRQARRRQGRDQRAPLQGCRPGIYFRMTGDTDNLAEIKTIGAVLSHYPINGSNLLRNSRPAAAFPRGDPRHPEHQPPVEARAATCHAEYETSLRTAAEKSSPGDLAEAVTEAQARAQRAIQHLNDTYGQVIPLVAGAWGELNGAFKQLLRHIVERQVGGRGGGTDGIRSAAWQHVPKPTLNASARSSTTRATTSTQTQRRKPQQAGSKTCSGFTVTAMRPSKPTACTTTTSTTSRTGRRGDKSPW